MDNYLFGTSQTATRIVKDQNEVAALRAELEVMRAALAELIDIGVWTRSPADNCSLYTIHLTQAHYDELIALTTKE